MSWFFLYLMVFLFTTALGGALCGVARRVGLALGLMDRPGGRKAHARPIALTGGWGIFASFMLPVVGGLLGAGLLARSLPAGLGELAHYLENIAGVRGQILAVLAGVSVMFTLGVVDDLRPLGPRLKLVIQILAILPLLPAGIAVTGFLPLPLGWLITVFWIVLLTNSFNLLDNMDGLSASVALVACIVMSAAAVQGGEMWLPALFLCLAGALTGFLFYNFNPASLFMGDAGSLTIGYLMGVFSILITYYDGAHPAATGLPVLMPLAIMGVPLFDTFSVMFIRWRAGKPLMVGDRNHFSHRLLAMGFGVRGAALTIAALGGACGLLALALRWLSLGPALVHLIALAMLFGVVAALELVGRRNKQ